MPPKRGNRKQKDKGSDDEVFSNVAVGKSILTRPRAESDSESSGSERLRGRGRGGGFKNMAQLRSSSEEEEESKSSSSEESESEEEGVSSLSKSSKKNLVGVEMERKQKEKASLEMTPLLKRTTVNIKTEKQARGKGNAKSNSVDMADIDTLLAEFKLSSEGASNSLTSAPPQPKPKPKATSKKSANKSAAMNDDDFDTAITEVLETEQQQQEKIASQSRETRKETVTSAQGDETANETEQASAKTLKNRLKKQKKKQAQENNEENTTTPLPTAKAKVKPQSAAAILAQKRLQKLEEENRIKQEHERRIREEEERYEREEAEKKRAEEEEREKRRKAKQEKKERQLKMGKPMTTKEKEKARKIEIARQQLLEISKIDTSVQQPMEEIRKKSRVVDDKKKKRVKNERPISCVEPVEQNVVESEMIEAEESSLSPLSTEPRNWEDLLEDGLAKITITEWQLVGDNRKVKASEQTGIKVKETLAKNKFEKAESNSRALSDRMDLEESSTSVKSKMVIQTAKLRSPICCILGHVDTGKTKLLDKIRHTNVQSNEAGGITQQIGATFFPRYVLWEQCKKVEPTFEMRVPGLLIIDTPGHESFNNLRARGSSLCDIAILVIDIMHGLEPQTRESLGLLRARKCPFVVALNKIDRLYGWAAVDWAPARESVERQRESTQDEFRKRAGDAVLQLAEEGLNCSIWWTVDDVRKTVSIAPTSAITGEGIPDLLLLLVKLTQSVITKALIFRDEFQCTILEVKTIEGLGTTIDVVLLSGTLYENDKLIVCGMSGPIVTTIRALLTPQPLRELRVKGEYIHHKEIHAAMGVKISAHGLEDAVAGTSVLVARGLDETQVEQMKDEVMADMASIFKSVDRSGEGVYVMASTLGSLEALLQFLQGSKIPVFAVNLGTVHKLDVKKASVMREKGKPELCCILAFDVKVDPDAQKEAQALGVRIFTADIIYHLFDAFNAYVAEQLEEKRKEHQNEVVFPCILSILPNCIFNKKDPIVLGVKVDEGFLKTNTPLCVPERDKLTIGRVTSIEKSKKPVEQASKGDEVAIKIIGDTSILVGRHFDHTHKLYSRLTRDSIDCLKEFFRDQLAKDDWKTVVKIKKALDIP